MTKGMTIDVAHRESHGVPPVEPLASHPDYAPAASQRREIALARTQIANELRKADASIARGFAARQEDETERRARAILAGQPDQAFAGFEELRSKRARLAEELESYNLAVRLQDERLAEIKSELSIDAAAAMSDLHHEAVSAISEALIALRAALDREDAVRLAVVSAGYDARLPSFYCPGLFGINGQLEGVDRLSREYGSKSAQR